MDSAVHRNQRASLRHDLLLAGDQRDLVLALDRDDPVVDLARQQPQREADHPAGMAAHPLDREMGLAGIGRARGWPSAARGRNRSSTLDRLRPGAKRNAFPAVRQRGHRLDRRQAASLRRNAARRSPICCNLTLTLFLHSPCHLPSGMRGGGISSGARGHDRLVSIQRHQRSAPAAARRRSSLDGSALRRRPSPGFGRRPARSRARRRLRPRRRPRRADRLAANGSAASRPAPRFATPPGRSRPASTPMPGAVAGAACRRPVRGSRARSPSRRSPTAPTPAGGWRRPTRSSR